MTQTCQLPVFLDFAFCSTEGCTEHTCSCYTVGKCRWCFMPACARGLSLPQNYTEGFVTSFLHILACSEQQLAPACPAPPVASVARAASVLRMFAKCTQNTLQHLNQRDLNLESMERQVQPRKQQLTSLLLRSQVTLQPKGDLSVALALLQDCQCQRAETNHCELRSLLK